MPSWGGCITYALKSDIRLNYLHDLSIFSKATTQVWYWLVTPREPKVCPFETRTCVWEISFCVNLARVFHLWLHTHAWTDQDLLLLEIHLYISAAVGIGPVYWEWKSWDSGKSTSSGSGDQYIGVPCTELVCRKQSLATYNYRQCSLLSSSVGSRCSDYEYKTMLFEHLGYTLL